ncbi:Insulin-like growth factor 2 mRNA-binding protein 1 [Armadillidium vulgare]|nr:Insulin-like growth factor 2 mRNA-binding protein 1 [Armadillidium vulgare]
MPVSSSDLEVGEDCSEIFDKNSVVGESETQSLVNGNLTTTTTTTSTANTTTATANTNITASDVELKGIHENGKSVIGSTTSTELEARVRVASRIVETADAAREAVQQLNKYSFEGGILKVERLMDRRSRAPRGPMGVPPNRGGGIGLPGSSPVPSRHTEFPLRILVLSEMVGAIIGRQGATIRTITQQTRARVDVHRKDNAGSLEKAITIYGNPENCTNACKRIMEVMQEESNNTNKGRNPSKNFGS